jgi:hypothetical protein
VDKFHDVLEHFGKVLCSHHHSNLSSFIPDADLERHRVMFVGLAISMVELINAVVPVEVVCALNVIATDVSSVIQSLCSRLIDFLLYQFILLWVLLVVLESSADNLETLINE